MTINQRTFSGLAMSAEQFLTLNGVPVISTDRVLKHEAETVRESRTGIWQWLPIIPLLYVRIDDFMIGNLPAGCFVLNRPEYYRLMRPIIMAVGIASLLIGALGLYLTGSIFGLMLGLLIGASLPFGLVHAMKEYSPFARPTKRFLQAGLYWQDVTYKRYYEEVPDRIRTRVELIKTLFPGQHTSILVRRFAGDPFILVVTNQERICFGAWNTGTELDEV